MPNSLRREAEKVSHPVKSIVTHDFVDVGDHEEGPHHANLRDVERRYADISTADHCIERIEDWRKRNR